ncbi:CGNR zinc finger domain-containing protein [Amycolatopsis sp. Hca4]|uniref:CGNR zinc finger domain-containing protein n=1 Tax=unclassified Amycolatopsis TaxID=2618356 RepID=UPI001592537B|nr:CGNR zinc finger domain-containing protein [Amycolatopsis sp. Hca4]QKV76729.1 CGNR zinc finger domain-containing protein [Amycolatopsis sp. Hca4]
MHTDASLVVEFLNTVNVEEGTDLLEDAGRWREWATAHALAANPAAEARAARDALRAAIGDPRLTGGSADIGTRITLTEAGPVLVAEDVVGAVFAACARLVVRGDWIRLKICPADTCLWAFYDESRNRSRTWCSMRVCGNREKARGWRARAAEAATG